MEAFYEAEVSGLEFVGEASSGGPDGVGEARRAGSRSLGSRSVSCIPGGELFRRLKETAQREGSRERALERENRELKQALATKVLEADFLQGVLCRIEARRQPVQRLRRDCIYEEVRVMRSAAHLSIESMCRSGAGQPGGVLSSLEAGSRATRRGRPSCAPRMQQIVLAHRRNYGYRRVTRELQNQGFAVNHKRVARLMAEDNLLCLRKRSFIRTTRLRPRSARVSQLGRADGVERDRPAVGGRHHLYPAGRRVPVPGRGAGRVLAPRGGLVAGSAAGCRASDRRSASGHRRAATGSGAGPSLRPGRAVCLQRLRPTCWWSMASCPA